MSDKEIELALENRRLRTYLRSSKKKRDIAESALVWLSEQRDSKVAYVALTKMSGVRTPVGDSDLPTGILYEVKDGL